MPFELDTATLVAVAILIALLAIIVYLRRPPKRREPVAMPPMHCNCRCALITSQGVVAGITGSTPWATEASDANELAEVRRELRAEKWKRFDEEVARQREILVAADPERYRIREVLKHGHVAYMYGRTQVQLEGVATQEFGFIVEKAEYTCPMPEDPHPEFIGWRTRPRDVRAEQDPLETFTVERVWSQIGPVFDERSGAVRFVKMTTDPNDALVTYDERGRAVTHNGVPAGSSVSV